MSALNDPETAMRSNLANVDRLLGEATNGERSRDHILVHTAVAQVAATSALVHAVRELTATIRVAQERA